LAFGADGLACAIRFPLADAAGAPAERRPTSQRTATEGEASAAPLLAGRRILVVEDEPLIAMEIEAQLAAAGCTVVGTAGTVEKARALIGAGGLDAALVDANLGGQ